MSSVLSPPHMLIFSSEVNHIITTLLFNNLPNVIVSSAAVCPSYIYVSLPTRGASSWDSLQLHRWISSFYLGFGLWNNLTLQQFYSHCFIFRLFPFTARCLQHNYLGAPWRYLTRDDSAFIDQEE